MSSISPPPELAYDSTLGPNIELAPAEVDEEDQEASHAMAAEIEEPGFQWGSVSPPEKVKKKKKMLPYEF